LDDSLASSAIIRGYHDLRQVSSEAPPKKPTRSALLKARLRYAEKGVPTSPANTKKKKPVLTGWQALATTDPRRIHAEFNGRSLPHYDGILTPTGKRYRRWVLDEDIPGQVERLEEALGVKLRGTSTEVRTQSDHLQIHFSWPEGAGIPNSVGKHVGDGFDGIDVRGEGGLVLLPPSAGYSFANGLPTALAPPELVEWATGRKKGGGAHPADGNESRVPVSTDVAGPPIPYGSRWSTMHSIAGRLHDGTRDLGQLTDDLEAINAARGQPRFGDHHTDRPDEVARIARLVYNTKPCRPPGGKGDPEFEELLEGANRGWYERFLLRGNSKSTIRETVRACLGSTAKRREVRTVVVGKEKVRVLVFAESTRELAELTRSSDRAVSEHLRQLQVEGLLVVLHRPPAGRTTYGLLPAAQWRISPHQCFSVDRKKGELIGTDTLLRCYELKTPPFGWRSRLTNAMRRILCIIEAFGPQSAEWLGGVLGTSRLQDLERRELLRLAELGLLERRDGREWGLPDDYLARVEALEDEEYSTTFRRRRRSQDGQRVVTNVVEVTVTASENERDALREARHAIERAAFAVHLEEDLREDDRCRELLNAWDDEREADGYVSELERIDESETTADEPDVGARSPHGRGRHLGDPEQRVERLVHEGMSLRFAQAEVYGVEDGVLGVDV
jgi:Bifunctional DNA primase/polymerase, N-terminal